MATTDSSDIVEVENPSPTVQVEGDDSAEHEPTTEHQQQPQPQHEHDDAQECAASSLAPATDKDTSSVALQAEDEPTSTTATDTVLQTQTSSSETTIEQQQQQQQQQESWEASEASSQEVALDEQPPTAPDTSSTDEGVTVGANESDTASAPQSERSSEPPIELVDGFSYTAASVAPDSLDPREQPIPPSFTVEPSRTIDEGARVLAKVRSNHRILDQQLLDELEENATACAENVSHLMGSLRSALHAITGMSVDYMMTYRSSVDSVGENVTSSILVMNTFIRNARQLNDGLKGAQHLQEEIKQIKRHLDILEANVAKMRRPSGPK